ncbi:hypothetical protein [Flavobacterium restrictum]|uniref:Carboxypeptidase-like regulatory domain-containing protein n=1 Tax=Flavobacterium restrictum TaxID=2594428 RepID=A0A553E3V5_9FLAO|nr:hypothetical protein [Flavobacterium restrictum]TRX39660.1 hypothetical protein FNW21_08095 [Flavobacterium restrictum]
MKKTKKLIIFLFLIGQLALAQANKEQLLHGKVTATSGNLQSITVVNLVTEKNTTVDSNGEFYILAKADDLLLFSSNDFEFHRRLIEEEDWNKPLLMIEMIPKSIVLDEVIVNKNANINAVSLGIITKDMKHYTPAERKLSSNSGGIIGLLNTFSGRKAMLKKELEVEKKELLLGKMKPLFNDDYYIGVLKIPSDYIKGFQYYCIEDKEIAQSLLTKNKTMTLFLVSKLAKQYKEILADEK